MRIGTVAGSQRKILPELRFVIPEALEAKIQSAQPEYLDRKGFVCLILDHALDRVDRLPAYRVGAGTNESGQRQLTPQQPSPLTGEAQASLPVQAVQAVAQEIEPTHKNKGINSKKPRAKRTKGSDDFETFWSAYQAIDHRANKQAKPQAWEVWKQLMDDGVSPDDLTRALSLASDDVDRRLRSGEFASPFPDCFRWLRDECYAVYLEDHQAPANQITVYG